VSGAPSTAGSPPFHDARASAKGFLMITIDDDQDQCLLTAIERGDDQSFWTLWLRHSERLFRVCLRQMDGNRVDAEDAHAQAMLRAHQKLPRFATRIASAASWLTRVTNNVCHDLQRARARSARAEEELGHHQRERLRRLVHAGSREERPAAAADWENDVGPLIARLPDRLRTVFVLRIVQQRPYEEIAARCAVSCVTARKRVQEARSRIRGWRDGEVARGSRRLPADS
jgi:RNA polymerase sigma-70 factor (ECF subfamily)